MGDHRSCQPDGCGWAARWLPPVLEAARAALDATGRPCAVACLACDDPPRILGTTADLWSAKGWRNSHRRRHDLTPPTAAETWAWKSAVLCVQCDEDGTVHLA
jgi:hypothetical protein